MNKIKNILLKNKKNIIEYLIIFLFAISSTIFFLKPHYSIDTIEFLNDGFREYNNRKFLADGRIFSALLLVTINFFKMPDNINFCIVFLYIISVFISCISVIYLKNIIQNFKKGINTIFTTLIAYTIIFNFMYLDAMQFLEIPIISLSVLFFMISAKILIEKKKYYILKSFVISLIAMFCYQGSFSIMIMIPLVTLLSKNKKVDKELIIEMLKIGAILLGIATINYTFIKLFGHSTRINFSDKEFNFIGNFIFSVKHLLLVIFDSSSMYPKMLQFIFIVGILIYTKLLRKEKIFNLLLVILSGYLLGLVILCMNFNSANGQYGRVFFSIGSLIGYILMYLYLSTDFFEKSKFIKIISIIYLISIILIYFLYTYLYLEGQKIDMEYVNIVKKIISEYEENTGNKIENCAFKVRENSQSYINYSKYENSGIRLYSETIRSGARIYTSMYTIMKYINIFENRDFSARLLTDEIYEQFFDGDCPLNEMQSVVIDDTLYIVF